MTREEFLETLDKHMYIFSPSYVDHLELLFTSRKELKRISQIKAYERKYPNTYLNIKCRWLRDIGFIAKESK